MPDSTGFGDYTETGQVIPVSFRGRKGGYSHCMFLNDESADRRRPRALGLSQEARRSQLHAEIDTLVGTLDYGPVRVATGTWATSTRRSTTRRRRRRSRRRISCSRSFPHVDGTPRICELVEYYLEDITVKGAWTGPARARPLRPCAGAGRRAAGARGLSARHIIADLTLGLGKVVHDYLR